MVDTKTMEIKQRFNEIFQLDEKANTKIELMPDQKIDHLFILWNKGESTIVTIDQNHFQLKQDCILFISEFHMEISAQFEKVRIIEFNKAFLGIDNSLNQAGDYLLVFYGYHFLNGVPKIQLNQSESIEFNQIWENMKTEQTNTTNPISTQLIRNSFQRMMLLTQKIHASSEFDLPIDYMNLRTIREFQYLVETNFKRLTKVADYAEILKVPPKKISALFAKHYHRKPTDLIAHRRNLHAQKQLIYSRDLIKNIAFDLNFSDSQSFSHFFKKMNQMTPETYRNNFKI